MEEDKPRIRVSEGVLRRPDRVNKFTANSSNETLAAAYGKPQGNNSYQAGGGLIKPHTETTTNAVRQRTHMEKVRNGTTPATQIENGFPRSNAKPPTGRQGIYSVQTDPSTIVSLPRGGTTDGSSRDHGPVQARGTPEYNTSL